MSAYLTAHPIVITTTHVVIACGALLLYIAAGIHVAFKIDRQRRQRAARNR